MRGMAVLSNQNIPATRSEIGGWQFWIWSRFERVSIALEQNVGIMGSLVTGCDMVVNVLRSGL